MTAHDADGNVVAVGNVLIGDRGQGKQRAEVVAIDADALTIRRTSGAERGHVFALTRKAFGTWPCGWRVKS